jgi:hypothetical protein
MSFTCVGANKEKEKPKLTTAQSDVA